MTTDQSTIATNGVAHASVGESFVDYPARVRGEIKPGGVGSIPYRFRRAANIVDVMCPSDVEIISAAFGRRRIDLRALAEQAGGGVITIADVLGTEPHEVSGGTFCVIKVRNKGDVAKQIGISLRVSNEHGPEVEDQSPFRIDSDTANGPTNAKTKTNGARSVAEKRNGVTKPRSKPQASARNGSGSPSPSLASKKKEHAAEVITVPVFIQPPLGMKVVILFRYYVTALNRLFASRAIIGRDQRAVIVRGLGRAHRREVGSPASLRSGEVAIILPETDIEKLYRAIQRTGEYKLLRSDNASRIHAAIKKALTSSRDNVVDEATPTKTLSQGDDLAAQAAIADD